MEFLVFLSVYMVPFVILYVVAYGLLKKCRVYESFIRGGRDGIATAFRIMPTLVGLMTAVGVLRASGFLDFLAGLLEKLLAFTGFPQEMIPYSIIRMFSSSAATGLMLDIFKNYGPDSRLGMLVSVMGGCTETVFYTMSVYFMTVKVTKSRYTLAGAMIASIGGIAASVLLVRQMFPA